MAISFECDYCGEAVYRGDQWMRLSVEEPTPRLRAAELDRMGLEEFEKRVQGDFHFHTRCFKEAVRMIDDHCRWAKGEDSSGGLQWELVEQHRRRRHTPAVLEPRYDNRILDLCRERGIDRDQLAEELGTSRGAVGRWLKSYTNAVGRPIGITAKWLKRLQMFFDLDSRDELFEHEPTGDAPDVEFVRAG